MVKECPNCGYGNPAEAKFCIKCGTSLSLLIPHLRCPRCGKLNPPEANFCMECGTDLRSTVKSHPHHVHLNPSTLHPWVQGTANIVFLLMPSFFLLSSSGLILAYIHVLTRSLALPGAVVAGSVLMILVSILYLLLSPLSLSFRGGLNRERIRTAVTLVSVGYVVSGVAYVLVAIGLGLPLAGGVLDAVGGILLFLGFLSLYSRNFFPHLPGILTSLVGLILIYTAFSNLSRPAVESQFPALGNFGLGFLGSDLGLPSAILLVIWFLVTMIVPHLRDQFSWISLVFYASVSMIFTAGIVSLGYALLQTYARPIPLSPSSLISVVSSYVLAISGAVAVVGGLMGVVGSLLWLLYIVSVRFMRV